MFTTQSALVFRRKSEEVEDANAAVNSAIRYSGIRRGVAAVILIFQVCVSTVICNALTRAIFTICRKKREIVSIRGEPAFGEFKDGGGDCHSGRLLRSKDAALRILAAINCNSGVFMRTDGSELEEHVRLVYETLLGLAGEQIVVTRGATLQGKSKANYNVDVFYEFLQAGIRHRVIFECKDYSTSRVERDDVLAFDAKIKDISQVIGVMVSRSGYQSGAIEYAEHERILLLTADELPTIGMLLASRLESATMPDEFHVGEPFWTLFGMQDNGRLTGEPIVWSTAEGQPINPLFISKRDAEMTLSKLKVENLLQKTDGFPYELVVRGVPQRVLRSMCVMANSGGASFNLAYAVPFNLKDIWQSRIMSVEEVKREFLMRKWQNF